MFNLFTKKQPIDKSQYFLNIDSSRCPQSHRCPAVSVCPVGALTQNGNKAPKVKKDACIKCGKCTRYCAYKAIQLLPKEK